MTVRSIVTFVQPSAIDQDHAALALALEWAGALSAQAVVLAFTVDVTGPGADDDMDFANTRAAIAALADRAGVPCTIVDRSSFAYGIGEVFADHMKVADLGVLTGRRGPLVGERLLAQAAIFDSGRPLVISPKKGTATLPRRVLIAWDGTHAAARAMQDTISLLSPGAEAIVVRVTDDKVLRMDQSGIEAAHHLARHGIKAEFREIQRNGRDIYDVLVTAAAEARCDLIVAGAVRHSPIHELVFGSVTGRVLDGDCPLPVLLSA
ncbi:universal stress protein [Tabrizicola sp.]|uniref:universal stress protein n=1 Tax=Tabrizicola sp. TaxID=2005166 RepID=UPI00273685AE|nr:universal stress protein [Tabrizicola sp.]MDP3197224.1 universal stress protein [Tabrizicola sp.]